MTPYEKEVQNMHLIKEWLQVDSTSPTGLSWKKQFNRGRARVGEPAGSPEGKGYYRVILNKIAFKCHRLVLWLQGLAPGPHDFCDHINRNKSDNRPENLRWVSRSTNMANTQVRNKHGFKYVCFNPKGGRYRAQWGVPNLMESKCFMPERMTRLIRPTLRPWLTDSNTIGVFNFKPSTQHHFSLL